MKKIASLVVLFALAVLVLPAAQDETKPLKPVNLAVNTKADEDEPHAVPTALFYASNAIGGKYTLMVSTRLNPTRPWGKGVPLDNVGSELDDKSTFLYTEKTGFQYLFFATKKDKEGNNFDIYAAQRFDARKPFSAPTPVQAVCTKDDELHPWLTADGRSLYFSRNTPDGWRVFLTTRTDGRGPGGFKEPKPIAELPPGFQHATLTPDGAKMYLQGPLENNRTGLFVSNRNGMKWGTPEQLELLNSADAPTGDHSPCLTRDGLSLYFASDRPGGQGGLDLYVIPTMQLAPKKK